MIIDLVHRLVGDRPQRPTFSGERFAVRTLRRKAAERDRVGETTRGIAAATEPEEIDAVAGLVAFEDRLVAIGNVAADPAAGCRSENLAQRREGADPGGVARRCSAEPRVVEGELRVGVDRAVRADAGRAV